MVALPVNAAPALSMLIAILLGGVALGGLAVWAWAPRRRRLAPLPREWTLATRRVLNTNERRVYNQLRLAFPKCIVMPKLPLVRLCQPATPEQVKFWYELIGAAHVAFAVCNPNGHVLLVIDLDSSRSHSRRSTRIKESVLAACGIQRLHCAADDLPSIDVLRSLIQGIEVSEPIDTPATETPTAPAMAPDVVAETPLATWATWAAVASPTDSAAAAPHADRPATRHEPSLFLDSFFTSDDRPESEPESESPPESVDWPPVAVSSGQADGADLTGEADAWWRRAPARLVGGR